MKTSIEKKSESVTKALNIYTNHEKFDLDLSDNIQQIS